MANRDLTQSEDRAKARRAENNNYQRVLKTLLAKLARLDKVYNTKVYLLVERNGRICQCASATPAGQAWLPPDQQTLVSPESASLRCTIAETCRGSHVPTSDAKAAISARTHAVELEVDMSRCKSAL